MNSTLKIAYPKVAYEALDLLEKAGFYPKIFGNGPIPHLPRYEGPWWLDPTDKVHPYAKAQVELLQAKHIPIAGYIIAHEVELVEVPGPKEPEESDSKITKSPDILPAVEGVLVVAGAVLAGLVLGALRLALIDPSFLVVIPEKDGHLTWVEVVNWYE
jgi:hypothetical protein